MIHEIKVLLAIIGLVLVIFLSGCIEHLNEGVVINKKYYSARTNYVYVNKLLVPIRVREKFCLLLQGNEKTELRCVSKKVYDSVHLGEYIVLGEKSE